jgi:predicted RNase H-like HicB family nuclease
MRDPTLRCLAEGRDGDWFAICIDLDIAVQGQSFPEVRDSLSEAIKLYLERVAELPEHERVRLLNRRSPWPIRAKFELNWLLSKL